jgi:hypothetical protein
VRPAEVLGFPLKPFNTSEEAIFSQIPVSSPQPNEQSMEVGSNCSALENPASFESDIQDENKKNTDTSLQTEANSTGVAIQIRLRSNPFFKAILVLMLRSKP